jgi:hypothetical protein
VYPEITKGAQNEVELKDTLPLCGSSNGHSGGADDRPTQEEGQGNIVISVI